MSSQNRKFIELLEFVEKELEKLRSARGVAMTKTEQFLLDGRIADLQRIIAEAYKIKGEEK